jgi:cyclophilin family peptidyl-prolyl cis-trans isomerase
MSCAAAVLTMVALATHAANPVVEMKTSLGDITIELAQDKAPVTVSNFLAYVKKGHFDGTVFHRVIKGFMNQGGGFAKQNGDLVQKESMAPIRNEAKTSGLRNEPGTIAMARTGDPHSATAQFFINVKNPNTPSGYNEFLDFDKAADRVGYTVFGKVTKGMDVVDKINNVATGRRALKARSPSGELISQPSADVPTTDVVIESVRVVTAAEGGEAKSSAN